MSRVQKIAAALLIVLLLAAGYGLWVTSDSATAAPVQKGAAAEVVSRGSALPVIDQKTLLIAQRLARYATTPEEQPLAEEAVQVANHELDLAFAAALHHLETHPPPLSPAAAQLQQRLNQEQKSLDADGENVRQLTAELARASDAAKAGLQDRLDLAQSQVALEQDEMQETNAQLLEAGGNQHQLIQTMQQQHQAAERSAAAQPAAAPGAFATLKGLVGQVRQWLALRRKERWLSWAQQQVTRSAAELALERQQIAAQLAASKQQLAQLSAQHAAPPAPASAAAAAPAPAAAPTTLLQLTRQIAAEQRRVTLRDERITARRRLAEIYGRWQAVVAAQAGAVLHASLVGATIVLAAMLLLLFTDRWLERLVGRARLDRRQMQTLRSVVGVALQLVGVVVILLVLIGLPGQLGTLLGIIGAGLTVALKDFIVAFIGWFVLMGRNGMRVGDWVEINGVSGEVIELNMFHTVLLETGNWTDPGHPTGRRVTFTNSFAIGGHYFNFSTSGQFLWDELSVMVPYERDPQAIAAAIQQEVTTATASDARQAEQEWRRVARGQGSTGFTAEPGVAIRPAAGGVEVAVRYVTRASERLALRGRLYQTAVQMLAAHA